ncbi:hypothetical protein BLNAU_13944 [Blattamonas nauphoetae]|uniref:Uncharacterized protein n=1 Tax=Blattamonas nauphoetae TaxID=2049346 RepID=A0ABQ9XLH4_9EUKA|nr:hypothetical protein BLNAU_13944 [Blattamonas nauphoetae]
MRTIQHQFSCVFLPRFNSQEALISFLIALSGVVPYDYTKSLESSGLFNALLAHSSPTKPDLFIKAY